MKLHTLQKKIKVDFLSSTKLAIEFLLNQVPLTMMYTTAIKSYRSVFNSKYPPDIVQSGMTTRPINKLNSQGGRGRGRRRSKGDRGRDRGCGEEENRAREVVITITLISILSGLKMKGQLYSLFLLPESPNVLATTRRS